MRATSAHGRAPAPVGAAGRVHDVDLPEQPFRVFDLLALQRLFIAGNYDRVICSTEALMGPVALYLKHALSVPAYFYLHTDWLTFAQRTLGYDQQKVDRVRRLLRAFYRGFDGLFVLNEAQAQWLRSDAVGMAAERVFRTAHWIAPQFRPTPVVRETIFPGIVAGQPVVLFAGRLSEEKGIFELPLLMEKVRQAVPGAKLVVAGSGPQEAELRRRLPDACFLGWVDADRLARAFSTATVFVLPSRFDTFGCVVLEALACGLPVVAYDDKGPKAIVRHGDCGYLGQNIAELGAWAAAILKDEALRKRMSLAARERAAVFSADAILPGLLNNLGLSDGALQGEGDRSGAPGHPVAEVQRVA